MQHNPDLFASEQELQILPLPDAELYFCRTPPLPLAADALYAALLRDTPWAEYSITIYGKTMLQPRLMAWYGDAHARYAYSGKEYVPLPWTPVLAQLRDALMQFTGHAYNSVLLNLYRDGNDAMGMHSDDEPELGRNPLIASLSLGAPRTFILRHKRDKTLKPVRLRLEHGSLLLMAGPTQHHWQHGINREADAGPRINLTFRRILARKAQP
ncbi:alpha-ketoglutarate-dependent dioxygenase AlkB [Massilia sp. W12]|uniref:alpha-ketoglutarate-dependent dioxygenase AlkB family protein n=1 Tax=Massilia sp. W12 TaxID=3126507 RepID=UPI0030D3F474